MQQDTERVKPGRRSVDADGERQGRRAGVAEGTAIVTATDSSEEAALRDGVRAVCAHFPDPYWRGVYVYQNIETAITQGIEWESRVRLSDAIDLSLSYNYLYSRNLKTQEKLINRPDHTVKFFLSAVDPKTGLGASFWGDYQSRKLWVARSNTGGNEGDAEYAPHRTRLNLNLFKRFSNGMEAFVRLENLLDETNITYGYWPGFEFFAGIKFGFDYKNQ